MKNKRNITLMILGFLIVLNICIVGYRLYKYSPPEVKTKEYIVLNTTNKDSDYNVVNILKTLNPDTVGYLRVKGTNIDYPVMQGADNDFYLSHDFNKNYLFAGSVFLDYRNDLSTLNKNNIIYAHAMNNGSMFGSLKNVLTNEWHQNKDNYIIELTTTEGIKKFEVISSYVIPVTNDYLYVNFDSDQKFIDFETKMINRSQYDYGAKPNKNDKLITLSTCMNHVNRVVVHARLITD